MEARAGTAERVVLREASAEDAASLAILADQLGYPNEAAQIAERLAGLPAGDEVHVAQLGPAIVGWIHLSEHRSLVVDPYAEVAGLVVADGVRGRGIGRALLALAHAYARARGLSRIVVRSNVVREAAHRFYREAGYRDLKRSAVFEREVE